ncbi:TonB-dependent receptor [Sphingomonas sp. ABOLD]|uniref:Outer membrane receptor protein involved in Fe transport n=1 Tax=Sphingomonas trueperi TaxID=53317 RepID=A0A7X5Y074_9SPHN|nr:MULTISPECIES: TonB-dependent receptor [Sphingomonas]NJB98634.1 outer membrane receptor protein involved in Fe transport [Sphingomonas trueperi]RSV36697.1 TonB-dependent receptor [Sphingomonas sp. ABOLE]RSV47173.1 TonB-dependent receptor [Sphingomonas sp. ABOLD]
MSKWALLLSAGVLALAAPAAAQDLRGSAANTPPEADNESPNSADIVVTATRRSERLSNVPIAVSAFGQAALQNSGATDIRQMTQIAPSLLVSSTGSEANASARVRGIGTVGDNPGLESSVAVFIDGIYRSRTGSGLNDMGEIERIEVLRGPQGTLSGRNSSAGAISIYTKVPEFKFGGFAEATYGNFDAVRLSGALTGPLVKDLVAFRLDGVYSKRDGYLHDVVNKTDYNDRDRYFVRGQLLFTVTPDLGIRLIADYTHRNEKCCGAVYMDTREKLDPTPGKPGDFAINPAGNRITAILRSMGGVLPSEGAPYNRQIAQTPGRAYTNLTTDYGLSARVRWNLGATQLTSLTAYREYKSAGAGDIDYGNVDIAYRPDDGNAYRQFHTFSHESRFSGTILGDRLDWLVGGYYAHEKLRVADNLRFGTQYGAFAACRMVATINPAAALRDPTRPGCLSAAGRAVLTPAVGSQIIGGIDRLSTLNDRGSTLDLYDQTSNNWALFTHNIYKLTKTLSFTLGARYTRESKSLKAAFNNNNTVCPAQQAALGPLLVSTNATLQSLAGGIVTLTCTGNSTAALTGVPFADKFKEGQLTGTAVLSWKPAESTLFYASYARGYKAGGYNLDRSDLSTTVFATPRPASVTNLRFDPETVNAFEIGAKYSARHITANMALYRSEFTNFQLNTFNGTSYIVQNIGGCSSALNGADRDNSSATGACTGSVGKGVVTQGVELELGFYPTSNFTVNLGYTLADAKYQRDLVGSKAGEPLNAALFLLPGSQMSNAPRNTVTSAVTWTPPIGSNGMTGLFYVDGRMTSDYNTGSDLFVEKLQDGFVTMNARIGVRGPDEKWAVELWAQNLLDTDYQQVAFNLPFQGAGSRSQVQAFGAPSFAVGNAMFGSFLAEPRTYGLTVRTRF